MQKSTIRNQFNKQADRFSQFQLTTNRAIFEFIYDFCDLSPDDSLLDVACGSGDFALFCADKVRYVCGCDISDALLKLAQNRMRGSNLINTTFFQCDVERISCHADSFTLVSCRSAFHHMQHCTAVFKEMLRCLKRSGKICIQDMIAYEDEGVNHYFEELDRSIDASHYKALSSQELISLFKEHGVKIENEFTAELTHNLKDYIGHAFQTPTDSQKVDVLVQRGLRDAQVAPYFVSEDDEICFKKSGMILCGIKQ